MKRECKLIFQNTLKKIHIHIDLENEALIMGYMKQSQRHIKKYRFIFNIMLDNLVNKDLYKKLKIFDIWEIRLFPGQENDRIYCQEIYNKLGKHIILSELHKSKKSENLSHKEMAKIKKVKSYDYGI